MKTKHLILLSFSLLISHVYFSQIASFHHSISNNDTSVNSIISSETTKSIVFFCPTYHISQDAFTKKADELIKNSKMKGISDLSIHFVYYKQDVKNNANGLKLINNEKNDTLFIGQFECFFFGFNTSYIERAKNKLKYNYDIDHVFKNENIYSIPIVDTNKCFEKMQDRIPFYADFIRESIYPNYSTDEKIQFLRDTLVSVQQELDQLKKDFETIKAKLPKNDIPLEKENNENSRIINSNAKPKSGTKGKKENANGKN